MKRLAVALLFCTLAASLEIKTWQQFKTTFRKQYSSAEEESVRRENFLNTLKWIEQNQGKNGVQFGINQYSDLSNEEFFSQNALSGLDFNLLNSSATSNVEDSIDLYEALPEKYDWREHIPMSPVDTQGPGCGACWAFAAINTVEALYRIRQNKILHLSRQELVDCTSNTYDHTYNNHGCTNGYAAEAFKYIIKHGVLEEAYYPYKERLDQCQTKLSTERYHIDSYQTMRFNASDSEVMSEIKRGGPVTTIIHAMHDTFRNYHGNLIMRNLFPHNIKGDHVVTLVGWGHNMGVDYWIIRNSWGESWGDRGYGYVERGHNLMGINNWVVYPIMH